MLMLSRKEGQEICIGDDVVVTVTRISGLQVAIGVDAPKIVPVHRREIYDLIKSQNGGDQNV